MNLQELNNELNNVTVHDRSQPRAYGGGEGTVRGSVFFFGDGLLAETVRPREGLHHGYIEHSRGRAPKPVNTVWCKTSLFRIRVVLWPQHRTVLETCFGPSTEPCWYQIYFYLYAYAAYATYACSFQSDTILRFCYFF